MAQIENGIRSILSHPKIYNLFQSVMGAHRVRTDFVENYVLPKPSDNILDIGCGTADTLAYLPKNINYFGFDQSQIYIDHARGRFGPRGTFNCALVDSMLTSQLPRMNIVLASGLIHHLDDQQAISLFDIAKSALGDDGRFIAIDPCYSIEQSKTAKWLIDRDRGQNVRDQQSYEHLANSIFGKVKSSVVHRKWIPYTHHIMICSS